MLKHLLSLLCCIGLAGSLGNLQAQTIAQLFDSKQERADRAYAQYSYKQAIKLYSAALEEEPQNNYLRLQLAESYRKLNNPEQSAEWYARVIDVDSVVTAEHYLHYAQALNSSGRHKEAKKWFQRYANTISKDSRGPAKMKGIDQLNDFYADSLRYGISPMPFNTEMEEFSPAFYDNGLLLVAARDDDGFKLSRYQYSWHENPFLDLYHYVPNDSGYTFSHFQDGLFNSPFHEGPLTLFNNGMSMVFTRNNYYKKKAKTSKKGVNHLMMYTTNRDSAGGAWKTEMPFPHNDKEHSTGHPTMTKDGKWLYFVSNKPGGLGGTDIYASQWLGENNWSEPVNLGPDVNTEGNEMFPFIHPDGTLYFASDGLPGIGGLDIYSVAVQGTSVQTQPKNMGYPVNSLRDDFGLIMESEGTYGYFASNRTNGQSDDDIFRVDILRPKFVTLVVKVVNAETNAPIPQASVNIDPQAQNAAALQTNASGTFTTELEWEKAYALQANKEGWLSSAVKNLSTNNLDAATLQVTLAMEEARVLGIGQITNKETGQPIEGAKLILAGVGPSAGIDTVDLLTPQNGRYRVPLDPDAYYSIFVQANGYFSKELGFDTKGITNGEVENNLELEEIVVGKAIKLDNIYYDLGKATIRQDAAEGLDKLVKILQDNPSIKIELSSHTDSRGGDAFNLRLSQRRAESAVNYILEQGIDQSRIVAKGYGETQLVNDCTNGAPCSKAKHQENRRTEFKVTEVDGVKVKAEEGGAQTPEAGNNNKEEDN